MRGRVHHATTCVARFVLAIDDSLEIAAHKCMRIAIHALSTQLAECIQRLQNSKQANDKTVVMS